MTQAAGFTKVLYPDSTGTQVDITTYVQSLQLPRSTAAIDVTTLGASGVRAVVDTRRGAVQANVSMTLVVDRTPWEIAAEKCGDNAGGLLTVWTGNNAAPGQGDILFSGTYTLMDVTVNMATNAVATMVWNLVPTDGGAVVPGYGRI
jgi:hypothetical protein